MVGARCSSVVRVFAHGVMDRRIDPSWWTHWAISRSSQCCTTGATKGCGMCYPVCEIVHIKEPLLLIWKSSPCGSSGFPLSLSEWSFTICLTPYNHKENVLSVSLNKTFPSFLPYFMVCTVKNQKKTIADCRVAKVLWIPQLSSTTWLTMSVIKMCECNVE